MLTSIALPFVAGFFAYMLCVASGQVLETVSSSIEPLLTFTQSSPLLLPLTKSAEERFKPFLSLLLYILFLNILELKSLFRIKLFYWISIFFWRGCVSLLVENFLKLKEVSFPVAGPSLKYDMMFLVQSQRGRRELGDFGLKQGQPS
jgi:hypothetical protein